MTPTELIEAFKTMTLGQLTEFRALFEETFDVSAEAVSPAPPPGEPPKSHEEPPEQTAFDVELTEISPGVNKVPVIKAVRELRRDLSLVDAKHLVDAAPALVLMGVPKSDAEAAAHQLMLVGGVVKVS